MVMSLFSVFDPVGVWGVSLNWFSLVAVFCLFPLGYWKGEGMMGLLWAKVSKAMEVLLVEVSFPSFLGLVTVSMLLFFYLSVVNSSGLFPYVFTGSSHLVVTLSLGLVFWFSFFLMGWGSSLKESSAHLVPEGSPVGLSPVLVMVESVSHLIRPITLSVRLAANMMAGHLIIGLIASMSEVSLLGMMFSLMFQSAMLVLEWMVVFIQAFVFSVLVMLYALDYY